MGFDPGFGKMINDITLFAKTFIQVIVAVISIAGPFDPAPDLRPVRELKCYFCRIAAGVEVDQVSKFLGSEITGAGECQHKKDGINDVALPGSIGTGNDTEAL
jgi:hypothetical protein